MIAAMIVTIQNRNAVINTIEFLSNASAKIILSDGLEIRISLLIFDVCSFMIASASYIFMNNVATFSFITSGWRISL